MIHPVPGQERRQRGFALVAAIFIIVVLAILGIMMMTIGGTQRATASAAVQGARAYHAARSGIEWGAFQAFNTALGTTCGLDPATVTSGPFALAGPGLGGFTVTVQCTYTPHREHGPPDYNVFFITSTATSGSFGDSAYVSRRIQITVATPLP
jgi:MSHA biogenesis protein MshP